MGDVFSVVFHSRGRGGPLTRHQNRMLWRMLRRLGTAGGRTRPGLLSAGGGLMAISSIGLWVVMLMGGFALLYLPHVHAFLYSPATPGPAWVQALYFSGVLTSTLGQGDVVPPQPAIRLLSVLQALGGFGLLTVSVTYVLAIYRELIASQTLAGSIATWLGHGPADLGLMAREHGVDTVAAWERDLTPGVLRVLEAHFQYPILHYFRSEDPRRALPPQLLALVRAAHRLDRAADAGDEDAARLRRHPSHTGLIDAIERYAGTMDRLFVPDRVPGDRERADTASRLQRLLRMMAYRQGDGSEHQ